MIDLDVLLSGLVVLMAAAYVVWRVGFTTTMSKPQNAVVGASLGKALARVQARSRTKHHH